MPDGAAPEGSAQRDRSGMRFHLASKDGLANPAPGRARGLGGAGGGPAPKGWGLIVGGE